MGHSEQEFQVTIPSKSGAGHEVQERIIRLLEELDYPPRDIFGMRLAFEEAVVNAMKHGNGMDPKKSVRIGCRISPQRIRIEIEDEGSGFHPDEVPDPTEEPNLEKPSGRGIMLMRAFVSHVEFNDVGNRVVLEKLRDSEADRQKSSC